MTTCPNITLISNCNINSAERFNRFIDSFNSIKKINFFEWIVNIRGAYAGKAIAFLEASLKPGLYTFTSEDSELGWLNATKKMSYKINSNLIFYWVEDHILLCGENIFNTTVNEFYSSGADWLSYSWFNRKYQLPYLSSNNVIRGDLINTIIINNETAKNINKVNGGDFYVSSLTGLYKKSFFNLVLNCKSPRLLRWPHKTPFDFEKVWTDRIANEINLAIPNIELFASIDDDMGVEGYSMISRGTYPSRVDPDLLKIQEGRSNSFILKIKNKIKNGDLYNILSISWVLIRRIKYTVIFHKNNLIL